MGAFIITYTILGVPYYNYSIMCPPNPILIWLHCSRALGRAISAEGRREGGREREREMARVAGLGG